VIRWPNNSLEDAQEQAEQGETSGSDEEIERVGSGAMRERL
jgi:hypothetical protein